jgi:hypothetical protein
MKSKWTRREFLATSASCAGSLALGTRGLHSQDAGRGADRSPFRGRFVTHVSVVRVNQIEVTPTRNIGEDEAADNRPARFVPGARRLRGAARTAR